MQEASHVEDGSVGAACQVARAGSGYPGAWIKRLSDRYGKSTLIKYNIEYRGITRVSPHERMETKPSAVQTCLFWLSINLEAVMVVLGMLGPGLYQLSLLESSLLGICGAICGSLPVAYVTTFGPRSGNRTMILTRYVTGWWPSKLIAVLTLIVIEGYSTVDLVVGGQILAAVAPLHSLSIVAGIVILALATWAITTFGYTVFHLYERYAWLPQLIVLSVLLGVAGPGFDRSHSTTTPLTGGSITANRLNFFGLCLSSQITYAQAAADFFVYYPTTTPARELFCASWLGLIISSAFTLVLGAGLTSGLGKNGNWAAAYNNSQGALIVEAFKPLGNFGTLCSVLVSLSLVGNMIPGTYAAGIDFQTLGWWLEKIPRLIWNTIAVTIPTICAIVGRERLATVVTNFLALVGYWVSSWLAIFIEEHLLFRKWRGLGWDWEAWHDANRLPPGVAALCAFLIGYAVAVLSMAQVWFVGPVAHLISAEGGDVSWAYLIVLNERELMSTRWAIILDSLAPGSLTRY